MEINFKQTLFSLESRNRKCNDCADDDVKYVSVNNGITLCELCSQIHKNFGNQISYIRSIDDEFDDYLQKLQIDFKDRYEEYYRQKSELISDITTLLQTFYDKF